MPVGAQTPREELIRLVPDDAAICLVLGDLRIHHDKLARSPWLKRLSRSPLGKALRDAPEMLKLGKLDAALQKALDVTWAQVRDDILGDAVVFAYRPGPPGKPDEEQGVVMVRARNRELLGKLLERLNRHQKEAGELKEVQARRHAGRTYHRRVESEGESFYFLDGPVLAFSAQEGLLREVLERRAAPEAKAKTLPLLERLKEAGAERALLTLWINPRAFDDELRRQAQSLEGSEAHVLKAFLGYWKALDGIGLSLTVERDPEVLVSIHARTADLPAAARRVVETAGTPTDLWQRFPEDSIFTAAARVDLPALVEALNEFLTPEARKSLSANLQRGLTLPMGDAVTKQILAALGPDCGLCVAAPADAKSFPHVLIALRVRPAPPGTPPRDKAILGALKLFAGMAVLGQKGKAEDRLWVKHEIQEGVEVTYFGSKKFPPGLRPAFAVKGGYLVLASSPEAVRRFAAKPRPAPPGADSPLIRLSLRRLATLLKERRVPLLDLLGAQKDLPKEQAGQLLDGLTWVLDLFDTLELTQRNGEGRVTWIARLSPWAPKK